MHSRFSRLYIFSLPLLLGLLITPVMADPPTQEDVNTYTALCKTGSLSKYDVNAEASLISRRLLSGSAKLSGEALKDEFPGIKDEKNRMSLIQGLQDCMYRYVERFHPRIEPKEKPTTPLQLAPSVAPEQRREILFLVNQLEDFKGKMEKTKERIPERYYDPNDSTEKFPRKDPRLLELETYNRYKAFQSPSGIPDFSNVVKRDIAIICDTFFTEVRDYNSFRNDWRNIFDLNQYSTQEEVNRICNAAKR